MRLPHPSHSAATSASVGQLTALLDDVILADLAGAVTAAGPDSVDIGDTDLGDLMTALPPLARVLRYGNVRNTDLALVEPAVAGLIARVSVGLGPRARRRRRRRADAAAN